MKSILAVYLLVLFFLPASYAFDPDPFGVEVKLEASRLSVAFRVPEKHYLYDRYLAVEADGVALVPETGSSLPVSVFDAFMGAEMEVYKKDFIRVYTVQEISDPDFKVTVRYMGCDDEVCFMPQSREFYPARMDLAQSQTAAVSAPVTSGLATAGTVFDGMAIIGRDAGYRNVPDFLTFVQHVEDGKGMAIGFIEALFARRGIWVLVGVLAILLGGLALNLTPCVLPMIPINLAIIGAGSQAGSRVRGFGLGATYGAGIALVYGILGLVVVLTGAQFGALNANPWFNLAIAVLFLLLALAMFDVFQIDFSRYQTMVGQGSQRGPVWTAFLFGGVAALLAGACVAPALISVLVLSTRFYQEGHQTALLLPFVLGLGMALPWPFAGAGLSFLPKPGRWMEWVKRGFGILILLAALYYGYLGATLLRRYVAPATTARTAADAFWLHDPAIAVAQAQETGKDLFVDFWATWCKNCIAMDRTTFQDESVKAALGPYIRLKYQAEDPSDPETKRVLDQLGVKGLPSYVVLRP